MVIVTITHSKQAFSPGKILIIPFLYWLKRIWKVPVLLVTFLLYLFKSCLQMHIVQKVQFHLTFCYVFPFGIEFSIESINKEVPAQSPPLLLMVGIILLSNRSCVTRGAVDLLPCCAPSFSQTLYVSINKETTGSIALFLYTNMCEVCSHTKFQV